jgi:hypothetical protein
VASAKSALNCSLDGCLQLISHVPVAISCVHHCDSSQADSWSTVTPRCHESCMLVLCGQRSEALGVYETCRRLLADELGMAPTARTTALYEQILTGEVSREVAPFGGLRGYELKGEIGSGTFGTVHRAVQSSIGRDIAIKVIRPEYANDAEFIRRFDAEAKTIARLEHPHIVPLYDRMADHCLDWGYLDQG